MLLFIEMLLQAGLPLKDRALCCSSFSSSPQLPVQFSACKPQKLKGWTNSGMKKATDAIQIQSYIYTCRRAEEVLGIPSSTLHDHMSDRLQDGQRNGPPKY